MPIVVKCESCRAERRLSDQEMLDWLLTHGMLRREKRPKHDLVEVLFVSRSDQFACSECGHLGVTTCDDWGDDWSEEVECEGCGHQVSKERLEVFPDVRYCAACQKKLDAGKASAKPPNIVIGAAVS